MRDTIKEYIYIRLARNINEDEIHSKHEFLEVVVRIQVQKNMANNTEMIEC